MAWGGPDPESGRELQVAVNWQPSMNTALSALGNVARYCEEQLYCERPGSHQLKQVKPYREPLEMLPNQPTVGDEHSGTLDRGSQRTLLVEREAAAQTLRSPGPAFQRPCLAGGRR